MRRAITLLILLAPTPAAACGGLFCGTQPVDQQAERIVFAIGSSDTDMIVQIAYRGEASEFAWILPLGFAPTEQDLDTFPALALNALDAATAPLFVRPDVCGSVVLNGGGSDADTPGVTVLLEHTVGPYDAVVVDGDDTDALVTWLRANGYRIDDAMIPFVEPYVRDGMHLLALKLSPGEGVEDIAPFRIRLPTTTPSIPLRLTAVAAEPEMGILVTILADTRYGSSNWSELEIDPATLRFSSHFWPQETDYLPRVAREADEFGGMGFVTELAGPTAPILEQVQFSFVANEEQEEARDALVALLTPYPTITRLYGRLSADEMRVDPMFVPRRGPEVSRIKQMVQMLDGVDQCEEPMLDQCDFALCGEAPCVAVRTDGPYWELPACACPAPLVARPVTDPRGAPSVACVDPARSMLDVAPGAPGDPCAGYDCGLGACVAVSMRATCACEDGAYGIGYEDGDGRRLVRCVREDAMVRVPPPSPRPDAGPPPDAGVAPMDAGPSGGFGGGGGGCAAGGAPARAFPGWLLVVGLLARRYGRSRRARAEEMEP